MYTFSSGLAGSKLTAALSAAGQSLTLLGVPAGLPAGTYLFRIDSELLAGSYTGTGRTFGDLQRGLDGTAAATHRAGVVVHHPITGESLNRFARATLPDPMTFVRSPALRALIAANFT